MSNPNLDRQFTFESIHEYYLAKLKPRTAHPLFTLPESFTTLEAFGHHLQECMMDIPINGTNVTAVLSVELYV